jgi:hypothetical protein
LFEVIFILPSVKKESLTSSPIITSDHLEISDGCRAVKVLRIGNIDKSVDAVSSASARRKFEEVVNFK